MSLDRARRYIIVQSLNSVPYQSFLLPRAILVRLLSASFVGPADAIVRTTRDGHVLRHRVWIESQAGVDQPNLRYGAQRAQWRAATTASDSEICVKISPPPLD